MTPETFVDMLKSSVRAPAIADVEETLQQVPGRAPDKKLVELSAWYHSLGSRDQECLRLVIAEAVDTALFGLLCVLDGVRVAEGIEADGQFELRYHRAGEEITLSPVEEADYLHDLYQAE